MIIKKIECKEYLFISHSELDHDNENNTDSTINAKKTKVGLKVSLSNGSRVKGGIHKFLRRK